MHSASDQKLDGGRPGNEANQDIDHRNETGGRVWTPDPLDWGSGTGDHQIYLSIASYTPSGVESTSETSVTSP